MHPLIRTVDSPQSSRRRRSRFQCVKQGLQTWQGWTLGNSIVNISKARLRCYGVGRTWRSLLCNLQDPLKMDRSCGRDVKRLDLNNGNILNRWIKLKTYQNSGSMRNKQKISLFGALSGVTKYSGLNIFYFRNLKVAGSYLSQALRTLILRHQHWAYFLKDTHSIFCFLRKIVSLSFLLISPHRQPKTSSYSMVIPMFVQLNFINAFLIFFPLFFNLLY